MEWRQIKKKKKQKNMSRKTVASIPLIIHSGGRSGANKI
jgi:hypothetical protein